MIHALESDFLLLPRSSSAKGRESGSVGQNSVARLLQLSDEVRHFAQFLANVMVERVGGPEGASGARVAVENGKVGEMQHGGGGGIATAATTTFVVRDGGRGRLVVVRGSRRGGGVSSGSSRMVGTALR